MSEQDKVEQGGAVPVEKRGRDGLAVVIVVLVFFAVVYACTASGGDDADLRDDPAALRYDAERVCKDEFIAKRLKAPATADYDLAVTGGPVTYTVSGTVDSENSFGAKLRSEVTCVVSLSGDQWKLDSLTGLN